MSPLSLRAGLSLSIRVHPWLVAIWLAITGCGYVGDPLPPALNIPARVRDLSVQQVGGKLIVSFTQPRLTTEGLPVRELEAPDLRINDQPVGVPASVADTARYEIPADRWAGQKVVITLRSVSGKRLSEFSNKVELNVVPGLARPGDLRAVADAKGVRLTWTPEPGRAGVVWQVFRRTGEEKVEVQAGTYDQPLFVDSAAVYGKSYEYSVRASQGESISETAGPVQITPLDTFAPSIPTALTAVAGVRSVELAWERSPERDLRGYRLYRAEKGSGLAILADFVDAPAFSDRQIESGKTYVYAVAALDYAGNESARSATLEVAAP